MFIEGLFARAVYRSLYKMHQAALHGGGAVLMRTLGWNAGTRPVPTVKLH
jgi:NADH dehydrogenase